MLELGEMESNTVMEFSRFRTVRRRKAFGKMGKESGGWMRATKTALRLLHAPAHRRLVTVH